MKEIFTTKRVAFAICLALACIIYLINTPHTTIRPGRGVQIIKANLFTATSIVYRTGLSERFGGEEISIYKNVFLLKNEATLRFAVHYDKRDGEVQLVWARMGNTIYAVMKPRPPKPPMRKREGMMPPDEMMRQPEMKPEPQIKPDPQHPEGLPAGVKYIVRVQDQAGRRFLQGEEADKIIKHTIAQAEKMLQETRAKFAPQIKKAQEKSRQWQESRQHERPRMPGPPNKSSNYQDTHRDYISQGVEQVRQGNQGEGAALLIDAILELKPKFVMLEQHFVDKLVPIKELFQQGNLQEAVQATSKLLSDIHQAYPNQIPEEPSQGRNLAENFQRRIMLATDYIQNEVPDIGAVYILEALALITPR